MKNSGIEWIGEIPEHWKILKFLSGLEKKEKRNEDHIDRKMLSVSQYLGIIEKKYESEELIRTKEESQRYFVVEPGDLVVNVMWLQYRGLGVSSKTGIVSPDYQVYKINSRIVQPDFLHHLVRSDMYLNEYPKHFRGIRPNSSRISQYDFMRLPLLLPPTIREQKQIADFLNYKTNQIDDNLVKSQTLVELLKEERQAIIDQAVTKGLDPTVPMKDSGIEWIEEIPEEWIIKRLKFISRFDPSSVDRHQNEGELQVLICHYPEVYKNEKITKTTPLSEGSCNQQEFKKFRLKKDDVLITKDSETPDDIGVPAHVEDDMENAVCGYHLTQISSDKNQILGSFLFRFLQSSFANAYFEICANGVTRFGIGKDSIGSIVIPLPTIVEQKSIILFLDIQIGRINSLIKKTEIQIEKLQEFRQSLISDVVTGKIDARQEILTQ